MNKLLGSKPRKSFGYEKDNDNPCRIGLDNGSSGAETEYDLSGVYRAVETDGY